MAIITGGGRGIGKAIATAYAAEGAKVVIAARSIEQLDAVATAIAEQGGEALAVKTDLRGRSEVEHLVQTTVDRFGQIDILVNNAGINPRGLFLDTTDEEWEQGWQVNVMGVVYCCRAVSAYNAGAGQRKYHQHRFRDGTGGACEPQHLLCVKGSFARIDASDCGGGVAGRYYC